jgi:hypothetical protein
MLCRFTGRKHTTELKPRSLIAAPAVTAGCTENSDIVRIKVTGTAKNALATPDLTGKIAVVTDGSSECEFKYLHFSLYTLAFKYCRNFAVAAHVTVYRACDVVLCCSSVLVM